MNPAVFRPFRATFLLRSPGFCPGGPLRITRVSASATKATRDKTRTAKQVVCVKQATDRGATYVSQAPGPRDVACQPGGEPPYCVSAFSVPRRGWVGAAQVAVSLSSAGASPSLDSLMVRASRLPSDCDVSVKSNCGVSVNGRNAALLRLRPQISTPCRLAGGGGS